MLFQAAKQIVGDGYISDILVWYKRIPNDPLFLTETLSAGNLWGRLISLFLNELYFVLYSPFIFCQVFLTFLSSLCTISLYLKDFFVY